MRHHFHFLPFSSLFVIKVTEPDQDLQDSKIDHMQILTIIILNLPNAARAYRKSDVWRKNKDRQGGNFRQIIIQPTATV
jgi:hypothetical protein